MYEGVETRYKAARLVPGNEYKARVKVWLHQQSTVADQLVLLVLLAPHQ